MSRTERILAWHQRLMAALVIVGDVQRLSLTEWAVHGHVVKNGQCDCEDSTFRPELLGICKHILAVEMATRPHLRALVNSEAPPGGQGLTEGNSKESPHTTTPSMIHQSAQQSNTQPVQGGRSGN